MVQAAKRSNNLVLEPFCMTREGSVNAPLKLGENLLLVPLVENHFHGYPHKGSIEQLISTAFTNFTSGHETQHDLRPTTNSFGSFKR